MRTRTNSKVSTFDGIDELERDLELENILGNLMIAQYQVDKLRSRLSERIGGYGSASNLRNSAFVFVHNDKKYMIKLDAKELMITEAERSSESLREQLEKYRKQYETLSKNYRAEVRRGDALFDKLNLAKDRVNLLTSKCEAAGIQLEPFDLKLISA